MNAVTLRIALFLSCLMLTLGLTAPAQAQTRRPDLDIQVVTFSTYTTYANINGNRIPLRWSSATIYVQNRGVAASQACRLRMDCWRLDDTFMVGSPEKTFFVGVPALAAGQETTVTIIQPALQFDFVSEHRVQLTRFELLIDCDGQVTESSENNNSHTVWGEING